MEYEYIIEAYYAVPLPAVGGSEPHDTFAEVHNDDAEALMVAWEAGSALPPITQNLGQNATRQILLNRRSYRRLEARKAPLQFFAPTVDTGSVSSTLGCGILTTASTAGGLVDATEE